MNTQMIAHLHKERLHGSDNRYSIVSHNLDQHWKHTIQLLVPHKDNKYFSFVIKLKSGEVKLINI